MNIPVSEIMSTDLFFVKPGDELDRVKEIFESHNIHHIPVIQDDGELVGMISKTDFARVNHMLTLFDEERYKSYNEKLYHCLKAKEIMSDRLATLDPEDTLSIAFGIFQENLFHALPVVEQGKLVGMLTTHDMLNHCCRDTPLLP